jgi:hypothetical protein
MILKPLQLKRNIITTLFKKSSSGGKTITSEAVEFPLPASGNQVVVA